MLKLIVKSFYTEKIIFKNFWKPLSFNLFINLYLIFSGMYVLIIIHCRLFIIKFIWKCTLIISFFLRNILKKRRLALFIINKRVYTFLNLFSFLIFFYYLVIKNFKTFVFFYYSIWFDLFCSVLFLINYAITYFFFLLLCKFIL